jgi:hypothetical protein
MTAPLNIHRLADLLFANQELDEIERGLKRSGDLRAARKISDVRSVLSRAIEKEQEGLFRTLME